MDFTTTTVMTAEQTIAWLKMYFFGKRYGNEATFTEVYRGASSWIYQWDLDENVEVIEVLDRTEDDVDFYEYTVNFYANATVGIPYRTGTTWVYDD
jgi:hypothetical protein